MAEQLGRGLAERAVCVISGGARGIDAGAHQGAFQGRLEGVVPTLAVLGSGIDVSYPKANSTLLARIEREGTVVSEYPPGTPAEPFRFPARNRIIAALALGVVVVEGAPASGSLITAEHAMDLGRDVFAVPGPVWSELAAAPLALIRDGAGLIRGVTDLVADLALAETDGAASSRSRSADGVPDGLSARERSVWRALVSPSPVEAIQAAAALPVSDVLAALVGLELRGLVLRMGGRYQRRLPPSA
jgi:DNA processing protein